jgi:hypothetical protein
MAQTIKSLSGMMQDIQVEGFQLKKLKRGLYAGYNLAYGVVDDKIETGFKILYQKDNDPNAKNSIEQTIKDNIEYVRTINLNYSPKGSSLIKLIDLEGIVYLVGYEVNGISIEFEVDQCSFDHDGIFYTRAEVNKMIKKAIKLYVKKVKIILRNKHFKLESYKLQEEFECVNVSEIDCVHYVTLSGKAYGKDCNFTIRDFETENIRKRLKIELNKMKKEKFSK